MAMKSTNLTKVFHVTQSSRATPLIFGLVLVPLDYKTSGYILDDVSELWHHTSAAADQMKFAGTPRDYGAFTKARVGHCFHTYTHLSRPKTSQKAATSQYVHRIPCTAGSLIHTLLGINWRMFLKLGHTSYKACLRGVDFKACHSGTMLGNGSSVVLRCQTSIYILLSRPSIQRKSSSKRPIIFSLPHSF